MDQSVTTISSPTFTGVTFTKTELSAVAWGTSVTADGKSFSVIINNIPSIEGFTGGKLSATNEEVRINNDLVVSNSVIVSSCSAQSLQLFIYKVTDSSFYIRVSNLSTDDYGGGNAQFNFVSLEPGFTLPGTAVFNFVIF